MSHADRATKQAIREFLRQRRAEQGPPPPIEEIRRLIGWKVEAKEAGQQAPLNGQPDAR